jgi:hypothetical protein
MMHPLTLGFRAFHHAQLRVASLRVPALERSEWLREWRSELWYARRELSATAAFRWSAEKELTAFCAGSFADSMSVRNHAPRVREPQLTRSGTASQCLLWLCAGVVVCAVLAGTLPNVQAEMNSTHYHLRSGLAFIHDPGLAGANSPTIALQQFIEWRSSFQQSFDGFAFYRTDRETALASGDAAAQWTVAHASDNLFAMLGLPILFAVPSLQADGGFPAIVLSYRTWSRDFHSDPQIAGRILRVGQREVRVAGVAPYGSWQAPGNPDAWLLSSEGELASGTRSANGFLIAHLTEVGESQFLGEQVPITAHRAEEPDIDLVGISLDPHNTGPWGIFRFAVLLAFLALPAVTSVTMNESSVSPHRPTLRQQSARWLFLASKIVLVMMLSGLASLDVAYAASSTWSQYSELVQLFACFALCLLGLRWALSDQQRRCPVCLRCVTHPAQVGIASRTFLGWNGTEMVCLGGHTLLHVPSLPTSWFGAPRWLYLDRSWEFLFTQSGIG